MAALPSLRQLSYLVTLSETLHFTEAARRSFVTQSTLSGGIMELERLLGGVLVERDRQNVRLTPLGEHVVARARVLLGACPIGERKNDHRLKASSLPTLVEMVSADLGFTLLPEIAIHTNMIKANPDLMVKQIEAAPSRILALVTRKSTPLQSEFDVLLQILQKITQDLH